MPPEAAAIIAAAGQGARMGGAAKPLLPLLGKPVLAYSLEAVDRTASVAEIVIVAHPETLLPIADAAERAGVRKPVRIVAGGVRRQDSVAAGLAAVGTDREFVVIHDAARPFATPALFDRCVAEAGKTGAAIAATPVVDTLKLALDGLIQRTVDRYGLWAAQTPQAFRAADLRRLLAEAEAAGVSVTDEAALYEAAGLPVAIVEGSRFNVKITYPDDLRIAAAFARLASERP